MGLVRWSNEYLIKEETIDGEHRYLFDLINDFYDAYMEKQSRQDVMALLNRLVDYAQRHFDNEERLMAQNDYPQRESHQEKHAALFEQVFALNEKLADRAINPTRDTVAFLEHWLSDHILQQDMAFGAHLAERRGDGAGEKKPA